MRNSQESLVSGQDKHHVKKRTAVVHELWIKHGDDSPRVLVPIGLKPSTNWWEVTGGGFEGNPTTIAQIAADADREQGEEIPVEGQSLHSRMLPLGGFDLAENISNTEVITNDSRLLVFPFIKREVFEGWPTITHRDEHSALQLVDFTPIYSGNSNLHNRRVLTSLFSALKPSPDTGLVEIDFNIDLPDPFLQFPQFRRTALPDTPFPYGSFQTKVGVSPVTAKVWEHYVSPRIAYAPPPGVAWPQ